MEKGYDFTRKSLKKLTKKDDWVLEVGCGPAWYRDSVNRRYIRLDIRTEPYHSNLRVHIDISGDGMFLPFKREVFDIVYFVAALYQMTDIEKTLNEAYQVLKKGGLVLIFDYNKKTQKYLQIKENFKRFCWNSKDLTNLLKISGFSCIEPQLPFELRNENLFVSRLFTAFKPPLIKLYELHQGWNIAFGKK